ncbi:MAG: 5-histidylcysteine sulfoxide synthase [Pseudohongiella sp.]|nr:5-histidylcysteine sulfoxide synthase [Pseudohongiella sp.]
MNQNTGKLQLPANGDASNQSRAIDISDHPLQDLNVQGLSPQPEPVWPAGRLSSLPLLDIRGGRAALLAYFENTWRLTETLFSALVNEEAYYVRPYHKTRHPFIFYYVHPVTFYVNKLLVAGLIAEPLNRHFEELFETGVDEMTWDDLHEGEQDIWPTVAEVKNYRDQVYKLVHQIISTHPEFDKPIHMGSPGWALVMCFEHERIHLETSSVLMRELPLKYLKQPEQWPPLPLARSSQQERFLRPVVGLHYPADNPMIDVQAGKVELGKPAEWPTFGWDNEYGHDSREVGAFRASKRLISNGEFYEFVSSGAYLEEKYWSEQGWAWRRFRNTRWPTFWVQDGPVGSHQYKLRTIFSEQPMQWDWPAAVNFYEAKAYCAWRSERDGVKTPYRLLHEKEHLAMRDRAQQALAVWQPGDDKALVADSVMKAPDGLPCQINHNLLLGSEGPVEQFAANAKGFHDVFGNLWQWCEDAFHPLPGFSIHPYYVDFSTPCYDNQHQMILGGSFISTGDEASVFARFHFRPHFFQHAGFRLVLSDEDVAADGGKRYETDALLNQYMLFHYASADEQQDNAISRNVGHPYTPPFMQTMAALVRQFAASDDVVLDLGCAVGRASFELARDFNKVIGLDYSEAFVGAAQLMQRQGSMAYERLETGRHTTKLIARVAPDIDRSRVSFIQGDAARLKAAGLDQPAQFDAVLLSNLMCRLPDPAACLRQFTGAASVLKENGVLVLASPNSWMEQYTDPSRFLDGADSEATLAQLAALLPGFELVYQQDLPFMIREHRRKYEYVISQVSVWRRNP